ncbi:MAG: citrate synthase [Candidatus Sericytochromatia bacterium]|nr:citrate synthase [Candidatus Sericytochromatia bacterium]
MLNKGLEDVVVATSSICDVQGDEGRLIYQGIDIHELAERATFEEVIHLLWFGALPTQDQLDTLKADLAANRNVPAQVLALMEQFPKSAVPMDILRTAISAAAFYDADAWDASPEANLRKAIKLTAQMATYVAAIERMRKGLPLVAPRADLSHAANFLYMLTGSVPDEVSERTFDVALTLHADHEFNASTFTARQIVSTLTDFYGAVTGAIASLSGPLHGGANTAVMEMLLKIGDEDKVEGWTKEALASKQKIMGFGHRVYKTEDPRATHLRRMSESLGQRVNQPKWFRMSQVIETYIKQEKGLNANVDFYSASAYYVMGIPTDLYTPIFAVSRVAGWSAHIIEQFNNNRLIRPRAEYIGPTNVHYVPIAERTPTPALR